jgi:hypothetical protein
MFPVDYFVKLVTLFFAILPATEKPKSRIVADYFLMNSHFDGPKDRGGIVG